MSKNLKSMLIMLAVLAAVIAGVCVFGAKHFSSHFLPGTTVNGISAGDKTVQEVKNAIQSRIREYTLTVRERGGDSEIISGEQLNMRYVDDGSVEKLIKEQKPALWLFSFARKPNLSVNAGFTFDKSAVPDVLADMKCFQEANITKPEPAHIKYKNGSYAVVAGEQGNELDADKTAEAVIKAVSAGKTELDFDKAGLYKTTEDTADTAELQKKADTLNQMVKADIIYDFKDRTKEVNGDLIRTWIQEGTDGNYDLDRDAVKSWVVSMARETDTFGLSHDFKTSSGETIKLSSGGDYGWLIARDSTTDQLIEAIKAGKQEKIEPIYRYKGSDRAKNDIGNTYIEICIEQQKMWCYKDGKLVVETPVVTGNEARGTCTPSGCVWAIDARESKAVFENTGGAKVDYWLPFNGNVGVHDASWRSNYGGSIYKTNGSHGCINTPHDAAGKIFDAMRIGNPVIVYYSTSRVVGPKPSQALSMG